MNERPQSIFAFQAVLSGGPAEPETGATRAAIGGQKHVAETVPARPALPAPRRNRDVSWKWVAVVVAMIVGSTGGYFVYQYLGAVRQRVQDLADDKAWKNATTQPTTIRKHKAYLVKFPKGRHHVLAMTKLGSLYYIGKGVPRDYAQARSWYEKAATKGNAAAMASLGALYVFGNGVPRDYARARAWWQKAAAKGHADAKAALKTLGWK